LKINLPYEWKEKFKYMGYEIHGKTLGIVGLRNIGMKVAKIAKAFEMKALVTKFIFKNDSFLIYI
jgi:phosphoglycerate dehydrogenase-like enzyme